MKKDSAKEQINRVYDKADRQTRYHWYHSRKKCIFKTAGLFFYRQQRRRAGDMEQAYHANADCGHDVPAVRSENFAEHRLCCLHNAASGV